ncbi:MAG: hypothetical protein COB02_01430 [Candidatus Cloacimonadota bacterium]|nr:MAG: hypothetical protein COB02_01430 [Candidatus Cloacimonadota bacterium]
MAKNDRALRFYNEVLGLDRLHYGMWDNDPMSLDGVRAAQSRYEDFLINSIPKNCKRILDVGCGTGIMSQQLKANGFDVEGISPDLFQQELYQKKVGNPFYLSKFEDFIPSQKYDCIIMSESCQYINLDLLFNKLKECLCDNGVFIVCDYFVLDHALSPFSKSGHNLNRFLKLLKFENFVIVKEKDITKEVTPTLDYAKFMVDQYILPSIKLLLEKVEEKHFWIYKVLMFFTKSKVAQFNKEYLLTDSEQFQKNKKYMFYQCILAHS